MGKMAKSNELALESALVAMSFECLDHDPVYWLGNHSESCKYHFENWE